MITIRNDSLSAEDIARAEELQRRYVERTRREAVPNSPSSTLYVPVSTVLDQNEDFYKRRETTYSPQVTAGYLSTEIKTEETVKVEEAEEPTVDLNSFKEEEVETEEEEQEEEETEEEEESEEAVLI